MAGQNEVDPTQLSIYERLTQYPDSYSDEDLREMTEWYEGQNPKGRNARFPIMAFLILEERRARDDDYTKEKK